MNEYTLYTLKPLCDAVLTQPSVENAKRFSEEIAQACKTPEIIPASAGHVILLPILISIKELNVSNGNEIKVHLFSTIVNLLKCIRMTNVISLKSILATLLMEISSIDEFSVKPNLSEEFKMGVIACMDAASRYASCDVIEEFFIQENRLLSARILLVCLDIVNGENYRALRIAAINCVLSFVYLHDEADFTDIVLRHQISEVVFVFLPKTVSTLKNVALGDEKQGEALIILAIKALTRILQLVMEDDVQPCDYPSSEDIKLIVDKLNAMNNVQICDKEIFKKAKIDNVKSEEWLHAASQKLQPTVSSMHKLVGHKNEKIRQELGNFATCLLRTCSRNMSPCIAALLEIQIAVREGDDEPLATSYVINERMVDVVEQVFLAHLTKLPRIIFTGDEDEQMAGFNLLNGLVRALSRTSNINVCLANEQVLSKLITALLAAVELDRPNQLLHEEHSIRYIDDEQSAQIGMLRMATPWKVFKNMRNQLSAEKIRSVCQLLGQNAHTKELVLDSLLRTFCTNSTCCNEILILFQYFVPLNGQCDVQWSSVESAILEELLLCHHWCLGLRASTESVEQLENSQWYEERTDGLYESAMSIRTVDVKWNQWSSAAVEDVKLTLHDVKFNVLHTCLILETVGNYASHLGDRYQPYLLNSLHRILEKSGSSHYMIHSAGAYALTKLQSALRLNSIAELIFQNADYITFHVNRSLRKADESQSALAVLSVVIKYSSLDTIPHLQGIIDTVLLESAKSYQLRNILSFLKVFHMILLGVRQWSNALESTATENKSIDTTRATVTHKGWIELLRLVDAFDDDDDVDMNKEPEIDAMDADGALPDEEQTADAHSQQQPIFIEFTLNILKRCTRFISSKAREEKLVALDSVCVGLDIIKSQVDDLLPMVDVIWTPFVERVRDNDPIILRRCFAVLRILTKYAKDFIYQRTSKDVLPFIIKFLKQSSQKSTTAQTSFSYDLTQEFKLQSELLTNLPDILKCINITEKEFNDILDATLPFLRSDRNTLLQQNCVDFTIELAKHDRPAVWLKLLKLKDEPRYEKNVSRISSTLL